jgi:hypothetical protein
MHIPRTHIPRTPMVLIINPHLLGTSITPIDKRRQALKGGKRISASGNIYYEVRRNRADVGRFL